MGEGEGGCRGYRVGGSARIHRRFGGIGENEIYTR